MSRLTPNTEPAARPAAHLAALMVGIAIVIGLMLAAFAGPALNSGAADLPLAVSGPAPAVAQVSATLDQARPGAFRVTTFATASDAADAITRRDAIGGIAIGADGVTIQTAAGAGAPYKQALTAIGAQLTAAGQHVTYAELVPTTPADPAGTALGTLALPLVFGGMAGAVALLFGLKGDRRTRLVGAVGIALLGGFTATAILQFGFQALAGSYWLTSLAVAAGIGAIGLTVLGLGSLIGTPGVALGAVTMLFVANPLSGLATGPAWLPQPWGAIGQFLPVGAAGTAIRSAAYFGGAGAGAAWLVLAAWIALGVVLVLLSRPQVSKTDARTSETLS